MDVLKTWRDSLKFFIPKNFKLFGLVSLKAIFEAYKLLLFRFWPVLLLLFAMRFVLHALRAYPVISVVVAFVFHAAFLFLCFLIIRPSIKLKNYSYVKDYWLYFIFFLTILLVHQWFFFEFYILGLWLLLVPFFISPLCIFITMFYLDGPALALKPFWQGLKMLWYNLPFCVVSYGFIALIGKLILAQLPVFFNVFYPFASMDSVPFAQEIFAWPIYLLFVPIPLVWFVNFYIKQVHAQFKLYMPSKMDQGE